MAFQSRPLALAALALLTAPARAATQPAGNGAIGARIDRLVEQYRAARGMPGIAVGVARNGFLGKATGYGVETSPWAAGPIRDLLLAGLVLAIGFFLAELARGLRAPRDAAVPPPWSRIGPARLLTGFITNFFDTLGIGSFATTTAIYRQWRLVRDELIPGTLNVGHTLPVLVQALVYTRIVPVDPITLVLMILASIAGGWVGANKVVTLSRRAIQLGMGGALLVAAAVMTATALSLLPLGGEALRLTGFGLVIGIVASFVFGTLVPLGVGSYAPTMIVISLLGMNPTTAFPIMMGSAAFMMPVASSRFIRRRAHDMRASLGLLLGGVPAVLLAAFLVRSLPLTALRWLVVVAVLYTAVGLLRAARQERRQPVTQPAGS